MKDLFSKDNLILYGTIFIILVSIGIFNIDTITGYQAKFITGNAPAGGVVTTPSPQLKIEILKSYFLSPGSYTGPVEKTCTLTSGTTLTCSLDNFEWKTSRRPTFAIRATASNDLSFVLTNIKVKKILVTRGGQFGVSTTEVIDTSFGYRGDYPINPVSAWQISHKFQRDINYKIEVTAELRASQCNPPIWAGLKLNSCWDSSDINDPTRYPNLVCGQQKEQQVADTWCQKICGKPKAIKFLKTLGSDKTKVLPTGKYLDSTRAIHISDITCENPERLDVHINKVGSGLGTVTSNDGKISCEPDCIEDYYTTDIILTAAPDSSSKFDGWGGDCVSFGTNINCDLRVGTKKTVTATFSPKCVASAEVCDGLDNDCDGAIDESLTRQCYTGPTGTQNVGMCQDGTQSCIAQQGSGIEQWSSCTGEVLPSNEICTNGVDDDCDGDTDSLAPNPDSDCSSSSGGSGSGSGSSAEPTLRVWLEGPNPSTNIEHDYNCIFPDVFDRNKEQADIEAGNPLKNQERAVCKTITKPLLQGSTYTVKSEILNNILPEWKMHRLFYNDMSTLPGAVYHHFGWARSCYPSSSCEVVMTPVPTQSDYLLDAQMVRPNEDLTKLFFPELYLGFSVLTIDFNYESVSDTFLTVRRMCGTYDQLNPFKCNAKLNLDSSPTYLLSARLLTPSRNYQLKKIKLVSSSSGNKIELDCTAQVNTPIGTIQAITSGIFGNYCYFYVKGLTPDQYLIEAEAS